MVTNLVKNIVIGAVVVFIIALIGIIGSTDDTSGFWLILMILALFVIFNAYFFYEFLATKKPSTPASITTTTAETTSEWTSKDTKEQIKAWLMVIGIPAGIYLFFVMLLPNVGSFMRYMVYIENWDDAFLGLMGLGKFVWYAFCGGMVCCVAYWWYMGRPGYVPPEKKK